uniref:Small-subunit processome Utp12 domain-containing protein n=1 Tax=Chlamydomonas euryale TaxID=1486919 RepID=A0A7R9V1J8_9CHLO
MDPEDFPFLARGKWSLSEKHYLCQRGARVSAADLHGGTGTLVAGYTNGLFELVQLPAFDSLQALSVSKERVTSVAFNASGDWIAVGCAKLGQLLVWEWRSDSYVLKQQGHYFDISAVAFSPDGGLIATGSDDRKVKVFQQSSGFCFVTFSEHAAPVTAVAFLPSGHALVSASLDGTVRAYDLVRYRNFRTMASPTPVQFGCVAVEPGGEIVAAGTVDSFQVYVWSLKTGRLLDILSGHEGPVSCVAFSPLDGGMLVTGSWDKTARTWDVYNGKGAMDTLQHTHDALAVAFRPDGKQLAVSTLDGCITLWDPQEAKTEGIIEGRRDIRGGRLASDRRAAGNLDSGACFTSLVYGADGTFLVAGGASKYVCIYDVAERTMLRRFQITSNRSLDGVLDTLNSKNMTDAGPVGLVDHDDQDEDVELLPPVFDAAGVAGVPGTAKAKRPSARTRCVALSPTNRCWAAACTEGLVIYSLDDDLVFDPTDLTEDLTPQSCHRALAARAYVRALLIALRLGDSGLVRHVVLSTPVAQAPTIAAALPAAWVPAVLTSLGEQLPGSPHLEFLLVWARAVCTSHGHVLEGGGPRAMPALRLLQKELSRVHEDLSTACEADLYTLEYLIEGGAAQLAAEPSAVERGCGSDGSGGGLRDEVRGSEAGGRGDDGEDKDGEDGDGEGGGTGDAERQKAETGRAARGSSADGAAKAPAQASKVARAVAEAPAAPPAQNGTHAKRRASAAPAAATGSEASVRKKTKGGVTADQETAPSKAKKPKKRTPAALRRLQ